MFFNVEDLMKVSGSMLFIIRAEVPFKEPARRYPYIQGNWWDIVGKINIASKKQIRFCRERGIIPPWDSFECERVINFIKYGTGIALRGHAPPIPVDEEAPLPAACTTQSSDDCVSYLIKQQQEFVGRETVHPSRGGWTQFLYFSDVLDEYCIPNREPGEIQDNVYEDIFNSLRVMFVLERKARGLSIAELRVGRTRMKIFVPPLDPNLTQKGPYR
jgi:hypothetical protein